MVFEPDLVKQVFRGAARSASGRRGECGPRSGARRAVGSAPRRRRAPARAAAHAARPFTASGSRAYESRDPVAPPTARSTRGPWARPFSLLPSMQALTLEVITRAVFGVDRRDAARSSSSGGYARCWTRCRTGSRCCSSFCPDSDSGAVAACERFEERRRALDETDLRRDRSAPRAPDLNERDDVFSTLLLARDEDGEEMTDVELRDELVTLLVAGHETTATGLAWAFDLLLHDEPAAGAGCERRSRRGTSRTSTPRSRRRFASVR